MKQVALGMAFLVLAAGPVHAETIELVTYYPSSATTGDLHARSLTVGTAYQSVALDDGEAIIRTNLGIGPGFDTLAPAGLLHVMGEDNQAGTVVFMPGGGTGTMRVGIGTLVPPSLLGLGGDSGLATSRQAITVGNAGLGAPTAEGTTSNGDKLVLWNSAAGTIHKAAIGLNNNQELWLQSSGNNANNKITFYTSNASTTPLERMRIDSNGNVGVGTASPQSPAPNGQTAGNLDVNDIFLRSTGRWLSGLPGSSIQSVYSENNQLLTTNNAIPTSGVPQITQGIEFLRATITPTRSTSRLRIRVQAMLDYNGVNEAANMALFRVGNSNALCAIQVTFSRPSGWVDQGVLEYETLAGTVNPVTFTVRVGPHTATEAVAVNGRFDLGVILGGTVWSTLVVEELTG